MRIKMLKKNLEEGNQFFKNRNRHPCAIAELFEIRIICQKGAFLTDCRTSCQKEPSSPSYNPQTLHLNLFQSLTEGQLLHPSTLVVRLEPLVSSPIILPCLKVHRNCNFVQR